MYHTEVFVSIIQQQEASDCSSTRQSAEHLQVQTEQCQSMIGRLLSMMKTFKLEFLLQWGKQEASNQVIRLSGNSIKDLKWWQKTVNLKVANRKKNLADASGKGWGFTKMFFPGILAGGKKELVLQQERINSSLASTSVVSRPTERTVCQYSVRQSDRGKVYHQAKWNKELVLLRMARGSSAPGPELGVGGSVVARVQSWGAPGIYLLCLLPLVQFPLSSLSDCPPLHCFVHVRMSSWHSDCPG